MSCSLSLSRFCGHYQAFARWRHWPAAIVATVCCLTFQNLALAQDADPIPKRAAAKSQTANEPPQPQVRDRDKLLAEQQRLLGEENKHAQSGKYAEAIKSSQQRESVLLELAKLPDRKAATNQMRLDMLQSRMNWQWLSGEFADAVPTCEQRLPLVEAEFGARHWQSANARSALDYSRKLAATDAPTRRRMLELDFQLNSAIGKGDFREAIAKADVLKDIEVEVLGVEHPFYAHSLDKIAWCCLQARDYERAAQEWETALIIRRKAYGDAHPDVLTCHDGLAAVARQQRHWNAAHAHYDRAAAQRQQLLGKFSPDDPAVWLDDFAVDSQKQYTVTDDVQWAAGRLTLSPGATIGRTIKVGSAWEARLDLAFPPASPDGKPSISRFEFTLAGAASTYALVWKTEQQDGQPRTRLQFVAITPKPAGQAGSIAGENVKVLREADWPHDPSGRWSLSWTSGLLQVQHGEQPVFVGYVESDTAFEAWTLRSSVVSLAVTQLELLGTARRVLSAAGTAQLKQADQDNQTVERLYQQGKFAEATKFAERVVEIRRAVLGEDHSDTAISLNNLGGMYISQGNYTAAEPRFLQAVKILELALGPDHPHTASGLNNLADVYETQLNYTAAEPLYLRSLKIREQALGSDHPDTATSFGKLAGLYDSQRNFAAAEPLHLRALKITEHAFGPDHPRTAICLNNLANAYRKQANYTAAEPLYLRSLKIREKVQGLDHPDTATGLSNLAGMYRDQGNYAAAEPLHLRDLKIREKVHGPDHPETAESLNGLAYLYQSQGKYAVAEPLFLRSLKIREKVLSPGHPDTARAHNSLAHLYSAQANYAAAEPHSLWALMICEKALGPDHLTTASILNGLALLYQSQGNYAAAEPHLLRVLKIHEKVLGPDHPDTSSSLNNLAFLYESQGNSAAAEPLFRRALMLQEKVLGPEHPETAIPVHNLASLYHGQLNFTEAEPLYLRALKIHENVLGPTHPHTAQSLSGLAAMYESQGNYAAAEPLCRRALQIRETVLGPDHRDTHTSVSNLALLLWARGQAEAAPLAERASGIRLRNLDAVAAIQTEHQQFLMSHNLRTDVLGIFLTVSVEEPKWTPAVYRDVLAWKGLITTRQQGLRRALKDDPLFTEFRQSTQQLSTIALSPPLPPSDPKLLDDWKAREPELRRTWESQKATLEAEHERLEKALAVKSVSFRESLEQRRVQPEDLVAMLQAQDQPTALVDVLEYRYLPRKSKGEQVEQRIVAFIVRGDRPVVRVELGSAAMIAKQVDQWRESFGRKTADHDPGAELRKRVWLPLEPHLQGIETVLISPDGPLAQLPWGALPGAKPGTYLLEDRAVAVIPVPQMLPALLGKARRAGPPESLLLAGDIEYGGDPGRPQDLLAKREAVGRQSDGRSMQFPNLDAAQSELTSIKDWYEKADGSGKVNTLRKLKATEAAFSEEVSRNQWLHVITHGFFAPDTLTAGPPPPTVAGIGAGLKVDAGRCWVANLVVAGAAQKDGRLQVGDEILSVTNPDGEPIATAGKSLQEIIAVIRGPIGTQVRLQVRPQSEAKQSVEVVLTRAVLTNLINKPVPVHPGLLSGLAFAGANTPPEKEKDDGILTAFEVAALDLNQVDAVVLSACETGLGSVAGGEGLLGLQRAFQVSGAKTVVASLWKVPDAATSRLMQRFYENLWQKKLPKLQALREAQLWMLKEGARVTDGTGGRGIAVVELQPPVGDGLPPYYWAAFVLSGDWR